MTTPEVEVVGGIIECVIPGLDHYERVRGIYDGESGHPETIRWTWEVWFTDHPVPVFAYT
jgi:hypothetical protein